MLWDSVYFVNEIVNKHNDNDYDEVVQRTTSTFEFVKVVWQNAQIIKFYSIMTHTSIEISRL